MTEKLIDHPSIIQVLFHPRREMPFESFGSGITVQFPLQADLHLVGRLFVADATAPVILFWHGNGEIAADYEEIASIYTAMGINFLVVDFRGYGKSDGTPSGTHLLEDGLGVLKQIGPVLEKNAIKTDTIVVMGRSMGSATAIEIAAGAGAEISGLIIESGFAKSIPLMERLGGFSLQADESQGFGNQEKISRVTVPTLIIHGEQDQIIPVTDGTLLYEQSGANNKTLLTIPDAGHNDLMMVGQKAYFEAIGKFMQEAVNSR